MSETQDKWRDTPSLQDFQRVHWFQFLTLVGFSVLEIGLLAFGNVAFDRWPVWVIAGGAIFFPLCAAISWRDLRHNWSRECAGRTFEGVLGQILAIHVILAALGIAMWILFFAIGWFATIPAWVGGIIILLLFLE